MHVASISMGMALVAIIATVTVGYGQDEAPGAAGAIADAAPAPGNAAAGKQTYDEICITCHAKDGKGNGGLTGGNFVDDKSRLGKSDAELIEIIKNGKEGKIGIMPALGKVLSDQQIRDVLAYIRATYGS
jgi:cbb3-type cytochrome c oxidase subunit III